MLSFQELYQTHKELVFNLALHYCQNREDAEEVTQDVFLTLHLKAQTFQKKSNIKTWIYRITVNKSLDFLKAKKTLKRNFFFTAERIDDNANTPIAHFEHPGVLLEEKEEIAKIFAAINQLSDKQKTIVILLKIEQKSQAEAAEIMNTSSKAVESLFQRAKLNLTKILKENEG